MVKCRHIHFHQGFGDVQILLNKNDPDQPDGGTIIKDQQSNLPQKLKTSEIRNSSSKHFKGFITLLNTKKKIDI